MADVEALRVLRALRAELVVWVGTPALRVGPVDRLSEYGRGKADGHALARAQIAGLLGVDLP